MANEMRLVDPSALTHEIIFVKNCLASDDKAGEWAKGYRSGLEAAISQIYETPTVDARPVVHGEWLYGYCIRGGIKEYESIDCSNCGDYFKIESHDNAYWKNRFKVCPFCGAVMDEVDGNA